VPSARSLAEWLALQETVHARSVDLGLARVADVAQRLALDHPAAKVITVGGTNGKGSTVAYLESLLLSGGTSCGAFVSPHLVRYNERVRVAGTPVPDAALVDAFERIEAARGATTLTFFEYSTLAALQIFADSRVEVVLLEVGLGGRLDATNLVDADVAVLCSVGFDHREWLGDTLESIGREKAGIFRPGRPAVLGSPDMPASVFEVIDRLGAVAVVAQRHFFWEATPGRWTWRNARRVLADLPPPSLPGSVQFQNAAVAIAALDALQAERPLEPANVARAMQSIDLHGRFEVAAGAVEWILDVAHNEPAARVLADNLAARPARGRTLAVAGILRDKDIEAIGTVLRPRVDEWICCTLSDPRGSDARELARRLGLADGTFTLADDVAAGCAIARERARTGDRVLVCGSFHTVGPALQWLGIY
jgi:dihydrofolate synthase/folylpolyglutamate synthase